MELKQVCNERYEYRDDLLIVPYGIETHNGDNRLAPFQLLIVPYGIETQLRNPYRKPERCF